MNELMNDPVTFENYQQLALRTEKRFDTPLARLEHAAIGLVTEAGESGTPVKRIAIYGKSIDSLNKDGKTTLRANIAEEIGDACWYLAIAADVLKFDFFAEMLPTISVSAYTANTTAETALQRQVLKLSAAVGRFAGAVSDMSEQHVPGGYLSQQMLAIGMSIVNICFLADLDLTDILAENIFKLRERFPEAYTDEAAEARADKGGLDATVS